MVALPGQLFTNTQIPPASGSSPAARPVGTQRAGATARGETLFIDARNLGYMKDRVLRDFTAEDIEKIADTFHCWKRGEGYATNPASARRPRWTTSASTTTC